MGELTEWTMTLEVMAVYTPIRYLFSEHIERSVFVGKRNKSKDQKCSQALPHVEESEEDMFRQTDQNKETSSKGRE